MQLFLYFQTYTAASCISSWLFDEATRTFKMQFNSQENIIYSSLDDASANTKGCTHISQGKSLTSTQLDVYSTSFITANRAAPKAAFCTHYRARHIGLCLFFSTALTAVILKQNLSLKGCFASQPILKSDPRSTEQSPWRHIFPADTHKYTSFSLSLIRVMSNFTSGSAVCSQKLQKTGKGTRFTLNIQLNYYFPPLHSCWECT